MSEISYDHQHASLTGHLKNESLQAISCIDTDNIKAIKHVLPKQTYN